MADKFNQGGQFPVAKSETWTPLTDKDAESWTWQPFLAGSWCVLFAEEDVGEGENHRQVLTNDAWEALMNKPPIGEVQGVVEVANDLSFSPITRMDELIAQVSVPSLEEAMPSHIVRDMKHVMAIETNKGQPYGWPAPPTPDPGEDRMKVEISLPKSMHDWLVSVAVIEERTIEQQIAFLLKGLITP